MKKAVAYYRMSSDQQGGSIEQQRNKVALFAKANGYTIIAEYVDEGLSGSKDTEKREAFARMLADSTGKAFSHILCWDMSRFGRLDAIEGAYAKQILRQNGVSLHTIQEGLIDWNTSDGMMKDFFLSQSNNEFSKKLGANTARGREEVFKAGYWAMGVVPYGYDRLYIDNGKEVRTGRQERYSKGRMGRLKIVPNEQEAAIVKRIYTLMTKDGLSLHAISERLNRELIPSPSGSTWCRQTVKKLITHPVYKGEANIGGKTPRKAFTRMEVIRIPNAHEALVNEATWNLANKLIQQRADENTKPNTTVVSGALSSLLTCGHCGKRMTKRGYKCKDGSQTVTYMCSTSQDRRGAGCSYRQVVKEDEMILTLAFEVVQRIDMELLRIMGKTEGKALPSSANIQSKIKDIEKRQQKLSNGLGRLPASLIDKAINDIAKLEDERQELVKQRETLAALTQEIPADEFLSWWKEKKIVLNAGVDSDAAPIVMNREAFRALLRQLGATVAVRWQRGKDGKCSLSTGEISIDFKLSEMTTASSSNCPSVRGRAP